MTLDNINIYPSVNVSYWETCPGGECLNTVGENNQDSAILFLYLDIRNKDLGFIGQCQIIYFFKIWISYQMNNPKGLYPFLKS